MGGVGWLEWGGAQMVWGGVGLGCGVGFDGAGVEAGPSG